MVWLLAINAQEISALIKKQIENFQPNFDVTETGVVTYIGDGIARARGLDITKCRTINQ